jgi:flavodoxin
MTIAVRYLSKSGNTEKVARAIAQAAGVTAQALTEPGGSTIEEETDVLFLGAAVYAFGIDEAVTAFIEGLDTRVKKVVVFSTTAVVKSAYPHIKKLLNARGIPLLEQEFNCRGAFTFMHKGRPNAADLEQAASFARSVIGAPSV